MRSLVLGPPGQLPDALRGALDADVATPAYTSAAEVTEVVNRFAPDFVVHVQEVDGRPETSFASMPEDEWDRRAERPLRAALWSLQAAHHHRASVVVVVATVGLEGAAGFVALASAAEGIRVLAKSAARRWGRDGMMVNVVAVPPHLLGDQLVVSDAGRNPSALESGVREAAATVALFAAAPHMTGATLIADGGALMIP